MLEETILCILNRYFYTSEPEIERLHPLERYCLRVNIFSSDNLKQLAQTNFDDNQRVFGQLLEDIHFYKATLAPSKSNSHIKIQTHKHIFRAYP